MTINPRQEERRKATFAEFRKYLAGRGTAGATSTEIAAAVGANVGAKKREYLRGVIQRATMELTIARYGVTFQRHRSDHPQGNFVYHLVERMAEVEAVRIECEECHEAKPRQDFACVYRVCSVLVSVCNACTDKKTKSARRITDIERKRHWRQSHRIEPGSDSRNALEYERPRARVKMCRTCWNMSHVRPEHGCPECGGQFRELEKPELPIRQALEGFW
jgi:hypothetical protein